MMDKLYRFYVDCGRMGDLDGLFIADDKEVKKIIGKNIWFDEPLGKHSEIDLKIKKNHINCISSDTDMVSKLEVAVGDKSISGFNPVQMYEEETENE
jgi:hypothetical protein